MTSWAQQKLFSPLMEWYIAAMWNCSVDQRTLKRQCRFWGQVSTRFDVGAGLDGKRGHKPRLVIGGPESHENGKFAWIMDPEGNKVELWEPMIWNEKNKSV